MRRHYYDLMDDKAPLVIVKVAEAVASWSDEHLKTHIGALLCSAVHSARNSNNWVQSVGVCRWTAEHEEYLEGAHLGMIMLPSLRLYQAQVTGLETKFLNISRCLNLWELGISVNQSAYLAAFANFLLIFWQKCCYPFKILKSAQQ